jgi:hypothetical protein
MVPEFYKKDTAAKVFFEKIKQDFALGKTFEIEKYHLEERNQFHYYIVELFNIFKRKYYKNRNFNEFKINYIKLKSIYKDMNRWTFVIDYINILIDNGQIDIAYNEWMSYGSDGEETIDMLISFEKAFKKNMVNGQHIYFIAPKKNQLTNFGKRNLEDVFNIISLNNQTLYDNSFFEIFYDNYISFKHKKSTFSFEYYSRFFQHNESAKKIWDWHCSVEGIKLGRGKMSNGKASQDFVKIAIREEASRLLREAENLYRDAIGAKKIGEAWISETELYYKLKNHFIEFEVVQHGRPDWLGRQHFDVWFPDLNIAIEYQGQQHDKPIDFFGGQKAFEQNKIRDDRKKQICIDNNINLIEVREEYDIENIINSILSFKNLIK